MANKDDYVMLYELLVFFPHIYRQSINQSHYNFYSAPKSWPESWPT